MRQLAERIERQEELSKIPVEQLVASYEPLAHRVQSGVAFRLDANPSSGSAKHLRTGLDLSKAEFGGLAILLVRKGLITNEEYFAAILEGIEDEVDRMECALGGMTGTKISLL